MTMARHHGQQKADPATIVQTLLALAGLSRREAADALGVSVDLVYAWCSSRERETGEPWLNPSS